MRAITAPFLTREPSVTPRYSSRPGMLAATEALVRATTYPLALMPSPETVPPPLAAAVAVCTTVTFGANTKPAATAAATTASTAVTISPRRLPLERGGGGLRSMRRDSRLGGVELRKTPGEGWTAES